MVIGFGIGPKSEANWVMLAASALPNAKLYLLDALIGSNEVPLCDVIVVDGQKPGPRFIELYRAHVAAVGVRPLVVLGSVTDHILELIQWEEHLTVFVPKPFRLEDLKCAILSAHNKRDGSAKTTATRLLDYLSSLDMIDLVQMLCMNHWSGKVRAKRLSTGEEGAIWVSDGAVIHAECGTLNGEQAFYALSEWKRCEHVLEERHPPVAQTITLAWQHLLLEAARRKDEGEARQTATA
jgi:hypothetical protein